MWLRIPFKEFQKMSVLCLSVLEHLPAAIMGPTRMIFFFSNGKGMNRGRE
jgi:hypothetical protein